MATLNGPEGLRVLAKKIERTGKQAEYAGIVAATRTAKRVKEELRREMKRAFDRPTPYTLNSVYVKPATKRDSEAVVWLKDKLEAGKGYGAPDYLLPQVHGGGRKPKRFERHLRRRGYLGGNEYMVPGQSVLRDRYGNVSRGRIVRVLSHLQAHFDPTQNTTKKGRVRYFFGRPGNAPLGVWERKGRQVKPVMVVVGQPAYSKRLDFYGVGRKEAERVFASEFMQALAEALKTAR